MEGSVSEMKNDSASISVFVAASIAGSFGDFVDALVLVSVGAFVGGWVSASVDISRRLSEIELLDFYYSVFNDHDTSWFMLKRTHYKW